MQKKDILRYSKVDKILELLYLMLGSSEGISLGDIQKHFKVSRRTAERMRDAALRFRFASVEEVETYNRIKRWKATNSKLSEFISFNADELSVVEKIIDLLERDNLQKYSKILKEVLIKIKAKNTAKKAQLETDLSSLLEAEGFVMKPGPRPKINLEQLKILRNSLKSCKKLKITYKTRSSDIIKEALVCPYGIVYNNKHYLLAWNEKKKDYRYYITSNILKIEELNEIFERDESFSLKKFLENSFGVFQEDPLKVKLKFVPELKEEVANFMFHPLQTIEVQKDNSSIVSFRAGGTLEMSWHLFTWGSGVEILEPQKLKDEYKSLLEDALKL